MSAPMRPASVAVEIGRRPVDVRTVRVDMTAHLGEHAAAMRAAVTAVDAMRPAERRTYAAAMRRRFAEWRPLVSLEPRPVPFTLEGEGNMKIGKNDARTVTYTGAPSTSARAVLTMSDGEAVRVVLDSCPHSGACAAVCVLKSGNGRYPSVAAGRAWRTLCAYMDPAGWAAVRRAELIGAADRHGAIVERGDTGTEHGIIDMVPELYADTPRGGIVRGYDYGKRPSILQGDGWSADGHHRTTYSWSESSNTRAVVRFLERGGTVAMVTDTRKGEPVPSAVEIGGRWWPTVDGDESDNRLEDPAGVVVILRAKGAAATRGRRGDLVRGRFVQSLTYV